MKLTDKYGKEIKVGHELNVPLEVFSNGIVMLDKENQLALELRFEGKKVLLKHIDNLEILN